MATLHKEYNTFNSNIALSQKDKDALITSRNALRKKIKKYFKEQKPKELQPKFWGQGSFEMNTTINPITVFDKDGNIFIKYDLDYGVYFIEKEGEDNKRAISTWHDWVYNSVESHTSKLPERKTTCIRVVFSDGHHIDLPIYYKNGEIPELAHRSKDWIESDPKAFFEWFNNIAKEKPQIRRIVRFLKAWKNFKETNNSNLKFPSGFALTILAVNDYEMDDNDDCKRRSINSFSGEKIQGTLTNKFECLRPTTPKDEDIFNDFSDTRKNSFLNSLDSLVKDCQKANNENNFKKASEYLQKHFGDRFPLGRDEDEKDKNNRLSNTISSSMIIPKPYAK